MNAWAIQRKIDGAAWMYLETAGELSVFSDEKCAIQRVGWYVRYASRDHQYRVVEVKLS